MSKHAICFKNSPRLTEQHHISKCDIRRIVKSANKTGMIDHYASGAAYQDMLDIPDFKSAMDRIAQAKSTFASMPAKIRSKFQNDPARFVEYCLSEATPNEALVKLGLANPVAKPESKSEANPEA